MEDKEIIIDGVDVNECFKYTKGFEEFDCGEKKGRLINLNKTLDN